MREFPYEQIVRDTRINRIFEGTNDILRLFIALNAMEDVGQNLQELAATLKDAFADPIKGFGVVRDYAWHRASLATGIKRGHRVFTRLASELRKEQEIFETGTRELASATDKLLRRHGKKIIEKQLATSRMADIMIDLYVLAAVLSRVTASIEKHGAEKVAREIQIAQAFASRVERQVRVRVEEIDHNADEVVKALADHAFEVEKYSWDTI